MFWLRPPPNGSVSHYHPQLSSLSLSQRLLEGLHKRQDLVNEWFCCSVKDAHASAGRELEVKTGCIASAHRGWVFPAISWYLRVRAHHCVGSAPSCQHFEKSEGEDGVREGGVRETDYSPAATGYLRVSSLIADASKQHCLTSRFSQTHWLQVLYNCTCWYVLRNALNDG
jgi:hypothetical protein